MIRLTFICLTTLVTMAVEAQSPLPKDLVLTKPGTDIPTNVAAFAGAWRGLWGMSLPGALVVEQVDTNGVAEVVYSWGDHPAGLFKAGWSRMEGEISAGKLHLAGKTGPIIDFSMEPDGTLAGSYQINGTTTFATLERIPTNDVAAIIAIAKTPDVPWTEVKIPAHSQVGSTAGKTLMLQTTIYPADGPGKHPVIIVNHGSTGGVMPATEVFRGGSEEGLFHSLGYIEVVPMRKGRGASEGPNMEESFWAGSGTGVDSAVEDLHAVMEYVNTMPDADTNRILLAGISRGGFLSVIYAGRYPSNIRGVLNFSGGWWGETMWQTDFNFQQFRAAGKTAKVPQLWLYGDHDSYYSLGFDEKEFAEFKAAGGTGEMVEVKDLPGDGHMLMFWRNRWEKVVTNYLAKVMEQK